MPRQNGSMTLTDGTGRTGLDLFSQISNANAPVDATMFDATMSDIANEITASYPKDGSAPLVADLNLGGNNVSNARSSRNGGEFPIESQVMLRSGMNTATGNMDMGGKIIYGVAPGVQDDEVATMLNLASVAAGSRIAGELVAYGGTCGPAATNAPAGFLWCNGEAVSRTTYAGLFAAIGTNFGAGDGSTTFTLPTGVGRFLVGVETTLIANSELVDVFATTIAATFTPGRTGGQKNHQHPLQAHYHLMSHTHTVPVHSHGMPHSHNVNDHSHVVGSHTHLPGSYQAALASDTIGGISLQYGEYSSAASWTSNNGIEWSGGAGAAFNTGVATFNTGINLIGISGATTPFATSSVGTSTISQSTASTQSSAPNSTGPVVGGPTLTQYTGEVSGTLTTQTTSVNPPFTTVNYIIKT